MLRTTKARPRAVDLDLGHEGTRSTKTWIARGGTKKPPSQTRGGSNVTTGTSSAPDDQLSQP
jgi:hypothetical protein